jgi:hypothetical protein
VVDNLDKAIANFRDNYGVKEWQVMSMPEGAPMRALALDCAQNKTMIEPIPGHDRNYKDWVPESDTAARFHHLGFLIDSADEYRQIADQFNTLDFRAPRWPAPTATSTITITPTPCRISTTTAS